MAEKNAPKDPRAKFRNFKAFLLERWSFRNDVVRNRLMWRKPNGKYEEVYSDDLFTTVQEEYGELRKNYIFDCVMGTCIAPHYNPLKQWIKSLNCDQELDYIDELCSYIVLKNDSVEERNRLYASLKKWFVGAIKTLFEPRYVHKQCIIWQGAQGLGKTPFVEELLPEECADFMNSIRNVNIDSKDGKIALTTSFIMNFDEVDQFFRSSKNRDNYKSYMTTKYVNVRLPFGRTEVRRLRITAFMGSCNESTFLNDSTGTQRFTIFEIEKFLNKKHGTDRFIENFAIKNVWAYAYKLYKKKFDPEYTIKEEQANEEANEAHKFNSDEFNTIMEFFEPADKVAAENDDLVQFMTATQIRNYLNSELKDKGIYFPSTPKIGKALTRLNYEKLAKKINNAVVRGYYVRKLKEKEPQWGPVIHPHKMVELN